MSQQCFSFKLKGKFDGHNDMVISRGFNFLYIKINFGPKCAGLMDDIEPSQIVMFHGVNKVLEELPRKYFITTTDFNFRFVNRIITNPGKMLNTKMTRSKKDYLMNDVTG